ncbi:MAG: rane dipeptidase [Gaiellaceae bacterium]|jgi:membrane dipeptidase|nr:rane dipeptidase [Gaiellaceae bacterium]
MTALIDCHSDLMIDLQRRRSQGEEKVFERVHLPELRAGGVAACLCIVGGDLAVLLPGGIESHEGTLRLVDMLRADIAETSGARIAGSASEVRQLIDDGVFAIIPALEGASPLRGDPALVGELHAAGVRVIGLTWNTRNEIAVGLDRSVAGERHDDGTGLTKAGREAIKEMNRIGVVVDVAHGTPKTFWDVVEVSEAPFIVSHANARTLRDHVRNLDDEQLRAVRDVGGMVGVVLYPPYVGPLPLTVDNVVDHIEYLVDKVGEDSVGIGADFIDYALEELVAEYVEHGIPYDEANFVYPAGVETCRSLSGIVEAMARRGFSSEAIEKIASGNMLRVLREVEEAAA